MLPEPDVCKSRAAIADSGATHHLTPCKTDVLMWSRVKMGLTVASGRSGVAGVKVIFRNNPLRLTHGVFHPLLQRRLVSTPQLDLDGGGQVCL